MKQHETHMQRRHGSRTYGATMWRKSLLTSHSTLKIYMQSRTKPMMMTTICTTGARGLADDVLVALLVLPPLVPLHWLGE